MQNNRNFNFTNTTLILGGIVVAAGVLLAAVIAAFVIRQAAPSASPAPIAATVVVTRDVPAPTLAPLPTFTPQATLVPLPTPTPLPTTTPTPRPTALPVPEWKSLGSLASMDYTDSVVVERIRARSGIGGVLLGNDRVVIMAVGRIVLGVDLNKISRSDVKIEGESGTKIVVRVPHASIVAVELLPDRSRIFDSERSWLFSQYEGLEVEALDEAKQKLTDSAKNNTQMLKLAETMARLQLTELVRKAGYSDVTVEFGN